MLGPSCCTNFIQFRCQVRIQAYWDPWWERFDLGNGLTAQRGTAGRAACVLHPFGGRVTQYWSQGLCSHTFREAFERWTPQTTSIAHDAFYTSFFCLIPDSSRVNMVSKSHSGLVFHAAAECGALRCCKDVSLEFSDNQETYEMTRNDMKWHVDHVDDWWFQLNEVQ